MAAAVVMVCFGCSNEARLTGSGLSPERFDSVINGKPTKLYTLKNKNGMEVCVTNFGGRIVSIMVPDRYGEMRDVVLGYDNIAQYADAEHSPSDFGAAIGRYMPTVSTRGASALTATPYSCRKTITVIVSTEGPRAGSTRCMRQDRPATPRSRWSCIRPTATTSFQAM